MSATANFCCPMKQVLWFWVRIFIGIAGFHIALKCLAFSGKKKRTKNSIFDKVWELGGKGDLSLFFLFSSFASPSLEWMRSTKVSFFPETLTPPPPRVCGSLWWAVGGSGARAGLGGEAAAAAESNGSLSSRRPGIRWKRLCVRISASYVCQACLSACLSVCRPSDWWFFACIFLLPSFSCLSEGRERRGKKQMSLVR